MPKQIESVIIYFPPDELAEVIVKGQVVATIEAPDPAKMEVWTKLTELCRSRPDLEKLYNKISRKSFPILADGHRFYKLPINRLASSFKPWEIHEPDIPV